MHVQQQAKGYADKHQPDQNDEEEKLRWKLRYMAHLDGLREGLAIAAGLWNKDYQTFLDAVMKTIK